MDEVVDLSKHRLDAARAEASFSVEREELCQLDLMEDPRVNVCLETWKGSAQGNLGRFLFDLASRGPGGIYSQVFLNPSSDFTTYGLKGKFKVKVCFFGGEFHFAFEDLEVSPEMETQRHLDWARNQAREAVRKPGCLGIEIPNMHIGDTRTLRDLPFVKSDERDLGSVVLTNLIHSAKERIARNRNNESGVDRGLRLIPNQREDSNLVQLRPFCAPAQGSEIDFLDLVEEAIPCDVSKEGEPESMQLFRMEIPRQGFLNQIAALSRIREVQVCGIPETRGGDKIVAWTN